MKITELVPPSSKGWAFGEGRRSYKSSPEFGFYNTRCVQYYVLKDNVISHCRWRSVWWLEMDTYVWIHSPEKMTALTFQELVHVYGYTTRADMSRNGNMFMYIEMHTCMTRTDISRNGNMFMYIEIHTCMTRTDMSDLNYQKFG